MRGLEWWNRFNLAFRYGNPVKFVSPQCNWFFQPFSFIIYRICLAIYMVTWLVLVIVYWGEEPYYPKFDRKWKFIIYFSNWTYVMFTAHFVVAAFNAVVYHSFRRCTVTSTKCATEKRKTSPSPCLLPWYLRLQWFLQTIAYGATPPLVSAYWQEEHHLGFNEYNWTAFNMHVHGVNYLILLIDTILVATPVKCAHCIYLSMYGFTYLIFTAVYFIAGGTDPYGEPYIYARWMNWAEDPLRAAVASFFGIVIILPLSQIVFVVMTYIRAFLSNRLGCNPQVDDECACGKDVKLVVNNA